MLESLVATLLNRFLGAYVSNLDTKQLNIAIWRGDVKLRDLRLKREALDKFDLPIDVKEGYLGELTLSIPWKNLRNQPVKVSIQDIYVLAGPRVQSTLTAEEAEERAQKRKQDRLANAELVSNSKPQPNANDAQAETFMTQLTNTIIHNLQVSISRVHVRYEDGVSHPGHPFAAGITLDEVSAISAGEDWQPRFVEAVQGVIRKLVKLGSLSAYWNTDTDSFESLERSQWNEKFTEMIATKDSLKPQTQYVLKPVSCSGRLTMNTRSFGGKTPKMDTSLSIDSLGIVFDEEQYNNLILLLDLFHAYLRQEHYIKLRPPRDVTPKSDPKAWIRYAVNAVLSEIHDKHYRWTWDHFRQRRDDRKAYIPLYVASRLGKASASEKEELAKLERKLSYEDIRFYRSLTKPQLRKEKAGMAQKQQNENKKGWFSGWFGKRKQKEDGEDDSLLSDEQKQELYQVIDYSEGKADIAQAVDFPQDTMLMRLAIELEKGSLAIRRDPHKSQRDIVSLRFNNAASTVIQYPMALKVDAALGDINLLDATTNNTPYPEIVSVKSNQSVGDQLEADAAKIEASDPSSERSKNEPNPFLKLVYELHPLDGRADHGLTLNMGQLEVIYNARTIKEVVAFFKPPKENRESANALIEVAGESFEEFKAATRAGLEYALERHTAFDISVDMDAPTIVVPESCVDRRSLALFLDAGHIHVESNLVDKEVYQQIKSKQKRTYEQQDYQELESVMYDKFTVQLSRTKAYVQRAQNVSSVSEAQDVPMTTFTPILDKLDATFAIEICILPKATNLTKIKISGELPVIEASFSDTKYKTIMKVVDLLIPKFDDDEPENSTDLPLSKTNGQPAKHAAPAPEDFQGPGNLLAKRMSLGNKSSSDQLLMDMHDDESDTEIEHGSTESDTPSTTDFTMTSSKLEAEAKAKSTKTNLSVDFKIHKVTAQLFQTINSDHGEPTEKLLVILNLSNFNLTFIQKEFLMRLDIRLRSLHVEDKMSHGSEFGYIITSETVDESQNTSKDKNLVEFSFTGVSKAHPEYEREFDGVDQIIEVSLSTLNIIVTRDSMLTLYNFILNTFASPATAPAPNNRRLSMRSDESADSASARDRHGSKAPPPPAGSSPKNTTNLKVQICLESVDLILNNDGSKLATVELSHGDASVLLVGDAIKVAARLASFSIRNDLEWTYPTSINRHILNVEGDELLDFRFETFNREQREYPGYDQLIFLRIGAAHITFMEEPVHQLLIFGSKFAQMYTLFEQARRMALESATQLQQQVTKLHFDIAMKSPVVRFLSGRKREDMLIAYLGEVKVINAFEKCQDAADDLVNIINAEVESIRIETRITPPRMKDQQILPLLDNVDLNIGMEMIQHKEGTNRPEMTLRGSMTDVNVKVSPRQYAFLMETVYSILLAVKIDGDEVEDEPSDDDIINVQSANGAIKSISVDELSMHSNQERLDEDGQPWIAQDIFFELGKIGLEIFSKDEDPRGSSLTRLEIDGIVAKFKRLTDASLQLEVLVDALILTDSRSDVDTQFRQILPGRSHSEPQFQFELKMEPPRPDVDMVAIATVDSPKIIFSLDYIFKLVNFFMAPFNSPVTSDAAQYADQVRTHTTTHKATTITTKRSNAIAPIEEKKEQQGPKTDFAFRFNVVDTQVILLANPADANSDAFVLSMDQIMLSQQRIMALAVAKVGMMLCRINDIDKTAARIIEPFDITMSMDSQSSTPGKQITNISIDVQSLVFRVSIRDIVLIMDIVNKAQALSTSVDTTTDTSQLSAPSPREPQSAALTSKTTSKQDIKPFVVMSREKLHAHIEGIRILLIDDKYEMPVVDANFVPFAVNVSDWSTSLSVDTALKFYVNFFNKATSHWEPFVEPWDLHLKVSQSSNSTGLTIDVNSRKRLEINFTYVFAKMLTAKLGQLNAQLQGEKSRTNTARSLYIIRNRSGHSIHIWKAKGAKANSEVYTVEDGQEIAWDFEDWRARREADSNQPLALGVEFEGSLWQRIQSIQVDKAGIQALPLEPKIDGVLHRFLVDITIEDEVKVVTFRSGLLFKNDTEDRLEIGLLDGDGKDRGRNGVLNPGDTYAVPIEFAFDGGVCVRPQGGDFAWCKQLFWTDIVQGNGEGMVVCPPNDGSQAPFRLCAFGTYDRKNPLTRVYPLMTVKFTAPITIENLLPYRMNFSITDKDSGYTGNFEVASGSTKPIYRASHSNVVLLSVELPDTSLETSEPVILSSGRDPNSTHDDTLVLSEHGLPRLYLIVHRKETPETGSAIQYSVYCPYVIVSKLNHPIEVKPRISTARSQPGLVYDCNHAEHPETPMLFSYRTEDSHNRAIMRTTDSDWSEPLSFEAIGSYQEVKLPMHGQTESDVCLGMTVTEGTGKYKKVKVIYLTPRYIVKNNLSDEVNVKDTAGHSLLTIAPRSREPLRTLARGEDPTVAMKFAASNEWSAPFKITDVGRTYVRVQGQERVQLVRVEVLLEEAAIFIVLNPHTGRWPFQIENESSVDVQFCQALDNGRNPRSEEVYEVRANTGRMQYAWDYPAMTNKSILLMVNGRRREVNIQEIGNQIPFRYPTPVGQGILAIDVVAEGPTQVLRLSNYKQSESVFRPKRSMSMASLNTTQESHGEAFEVIDVEATVNMTVNVNLAGISVSLINRHLQELAYVTLDGLSVKYEDSNLYQSIRLQLNWLQIDDQLYGTAYPILLYPSTLIKSTDHQEVHPTIHVALDLVKDQSYGVVFVKYFSFLLQEMSIEIDEDFIFAMLEFTKSLMTGEEGEGKLVTKPSGMPEPKSEEGEAQLYFEVFHIQPMRLNISVERSQHISVADDSTNTSGALMFLFNMFTMTIGNIHNAPVKLNALIMENARVSASVLAQRMMRHYSEAFVYQIHKILGSADVIGNPVGLFNTLSSGVAELFYEPYQGIIMNPRPQQLGIGIARGVGGFVKSAVFGISDSFSKVTGSISKGLAMATFDQRFQERRKVTMSRNKPKHAIYGVTQGAGAFGTSVASGVAGLVKQPLEGAQQEGAAGFLKGIAKGVVGAFTKPVVGFFDMANNVTEGIKNTTTIFDDNEIDRIRLPRYISPDGILRPYSQREALGQYWLRHASRGKYFYETYACHCIIDGYTAAGVPIHSRDIKEELILMLSTTRLLIIRTKNLVVDYELPLHILEDMELVDKGIILLTRHDGQLSREKLIMMDRETAAWIRRNFEQLIRPMANQLAVA